MATMGYSKLLIIFSCSLLLSLATLTLSDEDDPYFECLYAEEHQGNFTANSTFQAKLNMIVSNLSSVKDFDYGFHKLSAGEGPDKVFATALCAGDRTPDQCSSCLNYTTAKLLQSCPWGKEVVAWSQFCMVRYANRDIFVQLDSDPRTCVFNPQNASNPNDFNKALSSLLNTLSEEAATGGPLRKYAADNTTDASFQTVYAAVQCTPDLTQQNCSTCLDYAMSELEMCCAGRIGCRILRPSCILRFESGLFYNLTSIVPLPSSSQPPPPTSSTIGGKNNNTSRTVIIVIASVVGGLILVILSICILSSWRKKTFEILKSILVIPSICILSRWRNKTFDIAETADEISRPESLQFDLDSVLDATNNFSESNKLGEGGFGAVYKGQLPNGTQIAVKRLVADSGQGDPEFKNEVVLVAKLQHRNLVRLLGFCLEGRERILIYEFVPNGSLDNFIDDPIKRAQLDWDKRFRIIGGIARGLLYLHEDSRLRIVHRDLKPSNILLDEEMTPKISDFGMARLFGQDETHGRTSRVMGTYGYMAPEYIIHGQFSVKTDVFSFGVLLLEIISGQRSSRFRQGERDEYLLNFAWKNWREGTASNIIDPTLGDGSRDEITRCIHIGLLCVQEGIAGRPTINSVLLMLNSFSTTLPLPTQPAFTTQTNNDSDISSSLGTNSSISESNPPRNEPAVLPLSQNDVSITELSPR